MAHLHERVRTAHSRSAYERTRIAQCVRAYQRGRMAHSCIACRAYTKATSVRVPQTIVRLDVTQPGRAQSIYAAGAIEPFWHGSHPGTLHGLQTVRGRYGLRHSPCIVQPAESATVEIQSLCFASVRYVSRRSGTSDESIK